jgi:hypothetical protein
MDPGWDEVDANSPSPIALPHKALALLGIKDPSGFGPTTPPKQWNVADDDYGDYKREIGRVLSPYNDKSFTPIEAPPERLYFRPESLCSSFSTGSEHTEATTMTSVAATSPSIGTTDEYGTFNSESTIKELDMCMLNLEDSDEEEGAVEGLDEPEPEVFEAQKPTPELPIEIALQICQFFVTETHQEDMGPEERAWRCPNCDIYTLWALSLASRSWNKAANRVLYRTVSLDFGYYTQPRRDPHGKGIEPEFIPYTKCQGHDGEALHTKIDVEAKLQLLYRTIWDSQGDIGERIYGIKLPRRLFSVTKYPLSAILQKCPNIEFVDHPVTAGSAEDLVSILSKLTQMKRWKWKREIGVKFEQTKVRQRRMTAMVEMKRTMPGPAHAVALQVFPLWTKLQHLELNNLRLAEVPDEFDFCALPALESMALRSLCLVDRSPETSFLERLPHLQRLEIDTCLFISAERIISFIELKGSRLTHLHLRNVAIPIYTLYQVLSHTPAMVQFRVSNGPPTPPYTTNLPEAPVGFTAKLANLPALTSVALDMRPLRDCFEFLLSLAEDRGKTPRLHTMHMGFEAAGKRPELDRGSRAMDEEEMRMEVRLRTACLFSNVRLLMSE